MSSSNNDEQRLARWHLGKEQQDRLIERFKDRNDPVSILVVCDMLLTGFDAPVEQVMYLDAPLRVQDINRRLKLDFTSIALPVLSQRVANLLFCRQQAATNT